MKTAEEWANEAEHQRWRRGLASVSGEKLGPDTAYNDALVLIRAIQSEARRSGMLEARDICRRMLLAGEAGLCARAIEAAANEETEK